MLKSAPVAIASAALPPFMGRAPRWPENERDLPSENLTWERWSSYEQLQEHADAWLRLAHVAAERNPFYEFAGFTTAWQNLRGRADIEVVAVWAPTRLNPLGPKVLCAIFPLKFSKHHNGLPVRCAELWRHDQCFLTTPLIRQDMLDQVWHYFWEHIASGLKVSLIHFPMHHSSGAVQRSLVDCIDKHEMDFAVKRIYNRAVLQRDADGESYCRNQINKKTRNELTRLSRKLSESALAEFVCHEGTDNIQVWIEAFLDLENRSWKGLSQTSLTSAEKTRRFFSDWIHKLGDEKSLQRLDLQVNGQLIASKVNIIVGMSGFAFKIAYDSAWKNYSPGSLLEIENIHRFHEDSHLLEMDSCADPHHPMIDRLWSGRREIQSMLVSTDRWNSGFALASFPLMRWASRLPKRLRHVWGANKATLS